MIKEVTSYEEFEAGKEGTALIKLGAVWCNPCKTMDKILVDVSYESDINILKVDIDKFPEIASELGVMSIPTTVIYVGGKKATTLTGIKTKETILDIIKGEIN